MSEAARWGGPADMSAWEGLMWRAEGDPRTRSTGILLETLERPPDFERFLAAHRRATARIPRLRERVVEPTVPLVQPSWSADPEFDVTRHVHTISLPSPGDHRALLDLCEHLMGEWLDPRHPPWAAVLVTGLADGGAAYLLKYHHSLTDGLGLMQLLTLAHSTTAEPSTDDDTEPTAPARPPVDPAGLLTNRLLATAAALPAQTLRHAPLATSTLLRAGRDPVGSGVRAARFLRSLRTVLTPPAADHSPLLHGPDTEVRLLTLDVALDALKQAGKAAGGSINDAFVASVIGGLRRYHEHHDTPVEHIPIAMPVSLRRENDPLGGNRFAGVRFAAPLHEADPAARIRLVRDFVLTARDEPAIGYLDYLSPALTKLPTAAIVALSARLMTTSDVQISNIRGIGRPVYLAGVRVEGMYPLGPRPGVAAMVAMITYANRCCLGINVAPALVPDHEVFQQCIADGFAEVLGLAAEEDTKETQA